MAQGASVDHPACVARNLAFALRARPRTVCEVRHCFAPRAAQIGTSARVHVCGASLLRTAAAQIGTNSGHSALLWLLALPDARVLSFDIGIHRPAARGRRVGAPLSRARCARSVVRSAAMYLERRFPGRLSLILGDSTVKVGRSMAHRTHAEAVAL